MPSSQELIMKGMHLKQMHDEMSAGLADATKDEEDAIKAYEGRMIAKTKEVNPLSAQINRGGAWCGN